MSSAEHFRRGRPSAVRIRHIKCCCGRLLLSVSLPFVFSRPFTRSQLVHSRRQHSGPYQNIPDRAKRARSFSGRLPHHFYSISTLSMRQAPAPPTMSTAHQTRNMITHPKTITAPDGSSIPSTRIVLPNIALPSRPSLYGEWALFPKPPVYKVRDFLCFFHASV